jgi:hypothetical protein
LLAAAACSRWAGPRPGKLIKQSDRSNATMQVRLEIFEEGELGHRWAIFDEKRCHLRISSAPLGSDNWKAAATGYYPCAEDVSDIVRFVDDNVAYAFMQWWYTVTTDGGRTWNMFDVAKNFPDKAYYSPSLIERVAMAQDGTGTMLLRAEGVVDKKPMALYTSDFGKTWTLKAAPTP